MKIFNGASILITGGTGSIGSYLTSELLKNSKIKKIAVYSRDELKQHDLRVKFKNNDRLRWFLGDVRDQSRLTRALNGIDFVIHAAALKQVDSGEYNPMEFIKTNVIGSQNVIEASIDAKVRKVISLSTDKASSPINLYGATKLTSDKLFIAANNYSQGFGTSFAVVRYGNVMGSRGSVVPHFQQLANNGKTLPITDFRMTRFWISISMASKFILDSFTLMRGGELYVPKIPSMKIVDLARAISPNSELVETGIRPGEKIHEEMISLEDGPRTVLIEKNRYVILPIVTEWNYIEPLGEKVPPGFMYRSDTNTEWLSEFELNQFLNLNRDE
ncbi:UDP-N-acetylglucosamine 4,6-dehydratase (inverting) [bacterium]|nr:UDP-N-acetylglucosamine 4,6-dehydratase (inverting) [bacterium]